MIQKKENADWTDDTDALFVRYDRTHDPHIRERIILTHQNLVRYLAAKFANRGEPFEDVFLRFRTGFARRAQAFKRLGIHGRDLLALDHRDQQGRTFLGCGRFGRGRSRHMGCVIFRSQSTKDFCRCERKVHRPRRPATRWWIR